MRASAFTKIRWLRMINVKDCKHNCHCADKLRKILLKLPVTTYHEKIIDIQIKEEEDKYNLCFKKNYNN